MHIQTHVLAGWCISNAKELTARERLFCMLCSLLPDLDGLGILFGKSYYILYHHVYGHNLLIAFWSSMTFTIFSRHKLKAFLFYFFLFHLHLIMDFFGSGPGWPIVYFWPFSEYKFLNPYAWKFNGWQNIITFNLFVFWTYSIIKNKKRSPLELLWPKINQKLVEKASVKIL